MKISILLIFLTLTTTIYSQKKECILHFKNGTSKKGYIKLPTNVFSTNYLIDQKVKYKIDKNTENITEFAITDIEKIDHLKKGEVTHSSYLRVLKNNPNTILEVFAVHQAKVSLYKQNISGEINNMPSNSTNYFIEMNKSIIKINSTKALAKHLNDCPKLSDLIKREAFKAYVANNSEIKLLKKYEHRLIEIIKYYNTKCLFE